MQTHNPGPQQANTIYQDALSQSAPMTLIKIEMPDQKSLTLTPPPFQ